MIISPPAVGVEVTKQDQDQANHDGHFLTHCELLCREIFLPCRNECVYLDSLAYFLFISQAVLDDHLSFLIPYRLTAGDIHSCAYKRC